MRRPLALGLALLAVGAVIAPIADAPSTDAAQPRYTGAVLYDREDIYWYERSEVTGAYEDGRHVVRVRTGAPNVPGPRYTYVLRGPGDGSPLGPNTTVTIRDRRCDRIHNLDGDEVLHESEFAPDGAPTRFRAALPVSCPTPDTPHGPLLVARDATEGLLSRTYDHDAATFGDVYLDDDAPRPLRITNNGHLPLSIDAVRTRYPLRLPPRPVGQLPAQIRDSPFWLISDRCSGRTLQVGRSCTLRVAARPDSAEGQGPTSAELLVYDDTRETYPRMIQLTGTMRRGFHNQGFEFVPLPPERFLDTRRDGAPIRGTTSRTVPIAGVGDVPGRDVVGVILNATVTEPQADGYVTFYCCGHRPFASNLNYRRGETVANHAITGLDGRGRVTIYSSQTAHVVVDVAGYITGPDTTETGERLVRLGDPTRVLDTRVIDARLGPGEDLLLDLDRRHPVPEGATAVVANVTAVDTTAPTFVTVHPADQPRPEVSNLNLPPGDVRANLATVKLSPGSEVRVYNHLGNTDVIVDVVGYYTRIESRTSARGRILPIPPTRLFDTRRSLDQPLGPRQAISFYFSRFFDDVGIVDKGVFVNTTITEVTAPTHVRVFGNLSARPGVWRGWTEASHLNATPGETVPNLVLADSSRTLSVAFYNNAGTAHLIADLQAIVLAEQDIDLDAALRSLETRARPSSVSSDGFAAPAASGN